MNHHFSHLILFILILIILFYYYYYIYISTCIFFPISYFFLIYKCIYLKLFVERVCHATNLQI